VACAVGALLMSSRHPVVSLDTAPVSPEARVFYYTEAPSVFFGSSPLPAAATLLLPAATAALVYALFAVATTRDDLGAYPPVEPVYLPYPLPAEQAPTSAVETGER